MSFLRSFTVLSYATVLWAFVVLASTGQIHLPAIIAYLGLFGLCVLRARRGFQPPGWLMTGLSIVAFSVAAHGWFIVGERMYAVTYFLLYLQLHKLFTAQRNRDWAQAYGLTFFQILAASVSTTSILFAPLLLVYLFLMIAALMAFTMKRDAEIALGAGIPARRAKPHAGPVGSAPRRLRRGDRASLGAVAASPWLTARWTAGIAAMALAVVGLGSVLFWILPRATNAQFVTGLGAGSPQGRTGFAETVSFGDVSRIQRDSSIIMRAELAPEDIPHRPPMLRIRGTALDLFDGRRWTRSNAFAFGREPVFAMSAEFADGRDSKLRSRLLTVRITLEPEDSGYVFTLDQPRSVTFPTRYSHFVDEHLGAARLAFSIRSAISYETTGYIQTLAEPDPVELEPGEGFPAGLEPGFAEASLRRAASLGSFARHFVGEAIAGADRRGADSAFLQLPDTADMALIAETARLWTEGLASDEQRALEIQRRLVNDFGYTLDIDFSSREDHLSHFLRVRREGHCEYFATTMALMLRSLGIPARIVNGYLSDEWVTTGTPRFLVRQEHAHSWVEARFPGSRGWVTFDPTPPAGVGSNRIESRLYHRLSAYFDDLRLWWYSAVIDYDAQDQRRSLQRLALAVDRMMMAARRAADTAHAAAGGEGRVPPAGWLLVSLAGLALVAAGGWLHFRRRVPGGEPGAAEGAWPPVRPSARMYHELLAAVERRHPRPPSTTPLAHAQGIARALGGEGREFLDLTEAYYAARYDGVGFPPGYAERARDLARRLDESGREALDPGGD